tara:strand:+ start:788 stop:1285 length:498 start_codon:yes stop_codon:yes gene_type:complete
MIHSLVDVQTKNIGKGTSICQFSVILNGATIGENCNINCHTFIENRVIIGDNVPIKSGVYLWDEVIIEDNVFVVPNVILTNDKYPKTKVKPEKFLKTTLKKGCSIWANSTILSGMIIGENATVGSGSVVKKNIPTNQTEPILNLAWDIPGEVRANLLINGYNGSY